VSATPTTTRKPALTTASASRPFIPRDVGSGSRRNVERDALTVKGDLSKRTSLSMTQPAPQASSYTVVSLAPTRWAFGLRSASANLSLQRGRSTHRKDRSEAARPLPRDRFANKESTWER